MQNQTCCFFGHRDANAEIYSALYSEIEKHITRYNVTTFYVGGYGGFDRMSAGALKTLKGKYPHIEIILVLAYLPTKKKTEYESDIYGSTLYPEGLEAVPKRFAIARRNRWIAERSDYLIAYVRESCGGAYEALRYAKRKRKKVVNLADMGIDMP